MRGILTVLLVCLMGGSASAVDGDFGLTLGFRSNNAETEIPGFTIKAQTGLQFGGLGIFQMSDILNLRSGFLYTQRHTTAEADVGGATTDLNLTYLDIPVTLLFKFSDFGGAFIGPILSLNQSKDCGGGNCTNVASTIVPISLGVSFKFAPQMGGELVYENYSGKLADQVKNMNSLGANFVLWFE